jgi:hypothetical protein
MYSIYVALILIFFSYQKGEDGNKIFSDFAYNLKKPDEILYMPDSLKEISGIQYKNENMIVCIEDNRGIIYFYNTQKKEVADKINFEPKGDFEDLAIVKDKIYALRSDGIIFEIPFASKIKEYKTNLSWKNNAEGLCYDGRNNTLLIACKDKGGDNLKKHQKAIYSFSLTDYKLSEKPVLIIDLAELKMETSFKHILAFSPSGIALNPLTNHLFVISAKGNLLLELNETGHILFVKKLPEKLFSQPEGICFSPSGDLMISNEGKEGRGTILRFKLK